MCYVSSTLLSAWKIIFTASFLSLIYIGGKWVLESYVACQDDTDTKVVFKYR